MKKLIIFLLLVINIQSMSQTTIVGEYYFRKMEMASGFNFSKDGKFQFFYTYGAVDRTANGSFTVESKPGKGTTIRVGIPLQTDEAP